MFTQVTRRLSAFRAAAEALRQQKPPIAGAQPGATPTQLPVNAQPPKAAKPIVPETPGTTPAPTAGAETEPSRPSDAAETQTPRPSPGAETETRRSPSIAERRAEPVSQPSGWGAGVLSEMPPPRSPFTVAAAPTAEGQEKSNARDSGSGEPDAGDRTRSQRIKAEPDRKLPTNRGSAVAKSINDWMREGEELYAASLKDYQELEGQLADLEQRLQAKQAEVNQIAHIIGKPPVEGNRRLAAELLDNQNHGVPNSPATIARALAGRQFNR